MPSKGVRGLRIEKWWRSYAQRLEDCRELKSTNLPMQAFGHNQILFEPGLGDVVSGESATGNGLIHPTAPLPSNLPQRRRRPSSQSEGLYQKAATITH
jgi:hypothetical protein